MVNFSFWTAILLLHGALAAPTVRGGSANTKGSHVRAARQAGHSMTAKSLRVASHILPLKKTTVTAKSSAALHNAVRAATANVSLAHTNQGASYSIDIDFGGQTFTTIFDTGSSDLWLAQQDVRCVAYTNAGTLVPAECTFGPLVAGTFEDGSIDDENFYISYGDGERLLGVWGYEDVGIGGLTVPRQQVALVDKALWFGDNITSGLIGFAYPALTSAYPGNESAVHDPNTTITYNPWVFNAIDQGLMDPIFSLAIQRGSNGTGGSLALGGLPPTCHNLTYTTTDLHLTDFSGRAGASTNFSFYSIVPDGFKLVGQEETLNGTHTVNITRSTNFPIIVDSGTTSIFLPQKIAGEVNALYDPPAEWLREAGVFETSCDAVAPSLAITIGGTDFWISPEDLLLTGAVGKDTLTDRCLTGVQPSSGDYILGDVFLRNVVAAFDIGNSQMQFAVHDY